MTRALPLTQRQAQTLLRAAEREGGIVEVKVGKTFVRLIPASLAAKERRDVDNAEPDAFQSLDEYRAWRERSRAGGD